MPAAGQGTLALEAVASQREVAELLAPLSDPQAAAALEAERYILQRLGADCHSCLAIHLAPAGDGWEGQAMVARPDGTDMIRLDCRAPDAPSAAARLLEALNQAGAAGLLK